MGEKTAPHLLDFVYRAIEAGYRPAQLAWRCSGKTNRDFTICLPEFILPSNFEKFTHINQPLMIGSIYGVPVELAEDMRDGLIELQSRDGQFIASSEVPVKSEVN